MESEKNSKYDGDFYKIAIFNLTKKISYSLGVALSIVQHTQLKFLFLFF
jgi:hypothetical protein